MSRPLDRILRSALKWPVMLLLSLGVGLPPLHHLGLGFLSAEYIKISLLLSFVLALLQLRKALLPLTLGAFFVVQAALLPFHKGLFSQATDTVRILILWYKGVQVSPLLFSETLCTQFAIYVTLICCLFSASDDELYSLVYGVAGILIVEWLLGVRGQSRYMLLTLPALLMHYGATHLHMFFASSGAKAHPSPAILPVALIITLLSLLLAPPEGTVNERMAATAQKIRQLIDDHLLFDGERARYTLMNDGWMPEGTHQLGGPVTPGEQLLMTVETGETVYLRGAILDSYSGAAWYDTLSSKRYNYHAPQHYTLRASLLQSDHPLVSGQEEKSLLVTLQYGGASTLFLPQRLRSLSTGEGMVPYFNSGSEMFITRNLEAGDSYSATYLSLKSTDSGMAALAAQNAVIDDPEYTHASAQYLKLPAHIDQKIYDIAFEVTKNAHTPWQKAVALRDYLKRTFPYNLNAAAPPQGVDFVQWFLLYEKQGYCTYFASAMTVLCRILDIPARYVEGYLAKPDQTGIAHVYGLNAHAWTEVYINGVGWVTFDATAASGDADRSGEGYSDEDSTPGQTPAPTPSPSNTSSPAPSLSPAPSGEPLLPPDATPTPTPQRSETPAPSKDQKPNDPSEQSPTTPWLLLLLLIAIIVFLAYRIRETDPLRAADRAANDGAALTILWQAMLACAAGLGMKQAAQDTPLQFGAHVEARLGVRLSAVAEAISALHYGRHAPRKDVLPLARDAYQALHEQLSLPQKLLFALRRACSFPLRKRSKH